MGGRNSDEARAAAVLQIIADELGTADERHLSPERLETFAQILDQVAASMLVNAAHTRPSAEAAGLQ